MGRGARRADRRGDRRDGSRSACPCPAASPTRNRSNRRASPRSRPRPRRRARHRRDRSARGFEERRIRHHLREAARRERGRRREQIAFDDRQPIGAIVARDILHREPRQSRDRAPAQQLSSPARAPPGNGSRRRSRIRYRARDPARAPVPKPPAATPDRSRRDNHRWAGAASRGRRAACVVAGRNELCRRAHAEASPSSFSTARGRASRPSPAPSSDAGSAPALPSMTLVCVGDLQDHRLDAGRGRASPAARTGGRCQLVREQLPHGLSKPVLSSQCERQSKRLGLTLQALVLCSLAGKAPSSKEEAATWQ